MSARKNILRWNVAFGGLAVTALIAIGCYAELKSPDWAAWVQAVGSVVAITAGFVLADRQSRVAALQSHRERLVTDNEQARCVLAVAMLVRGQLEPALNEMRDKESVFGYLEVSADYVDFDGAKRAIDSVPIFQLRSSTAMQGVLMLDTCLSTVARMTRMGQEDPGFGNRDYYEFQDAAIATLADLETATQHIVDMAEQCRVVLLDHDDRHGRVR